MGVQCFETEVRVHVCLFLLVVSQCFWRSPCLHLGYFLYLSSSARLDSWTAGQLDKLMSW